MGHGSVADKDKTRDGLLGTSISGRILIVDDEEALRRIISRVLLKSGHEVVEARDGQMAEELVTSQPFDVIISDIAMPSMNGIQLLKAVRARDLDVPVILMSGMPDIGTAQQAVEYGAMQYLTKPVDLSRLELLVARALKLHRMATAKRHALEGLGTSAQPGDRAGLEASFERAIKSIRLAYQPILRASDGSLFGYEALLRSDEPTLPHPGAILDASDKLGRRVELGRAIRAQAAGVMATVPEQGSLFLNLHPHDLIDDLLGSPDSALAKIARRVVLEITERASLDDVKDLRPRVARLREMGFRIAIDDMGAGYAGLNSFAQLEPEIVKIDMSIVRDVDRTPTKQKLVRSLTSLCKDMDILVVAEGVENVNERDTLIELGSELLQGYLFARPGPPFPSFTMGS
jgi:EAL domain-containing protein (putative c-di-GMP-specific phosphodiesterase class I)